MIKKKVSFMVLLGIILLIMSPLVFADAHLPEGILKGIEYNQQQAEIFLTSITYFIAFLAGITTILSPCILPLIPAYFAVTFKERERKTLALSLFFIGFTTVFILMGLLATLTGKALIMVFGGIDGLVPAAGLFLIFFGGLMILGKGFAGLSVRHKFGKGTFALLASGAAFAIGWTACIGPILSGVILMAGVIENYTRAVLLMLFYSLGIFVPLFILSFFQDKIKLDTLKILTKEITFSIGKKQFRTNYPNVIAGSLFIIIGGTFILFRGTQIVNGLQFFGLREYFYTLQDLFLAQVKLFNILGIILFILFMILLLFFVVKDLRPKGENNGK